MINVEEVASLAYRENLHTKFKGATYFGVNQEWSDNEEQREFGCASSGMYNLLFYRKGQLYQSKYLEEQAFDADADNQLKEDIGLLYRYISPFYLSSILPERLFGIRFFRKYKIPRSIGIFSGKNFKIKVNRYFTHCLMLDKPETSILNVTKVNELSRYMHFIREKLKQDIPVLCLNTFSKVELYISGKSFVDSENETHKIMQLFDMKKSKFSTHWVMITGLYVVEYKNQKKGCKESRYLVQCSTWGEIGYFFLDELVTMNSFLRIAFPPCFVTFQWD